MATLSYTASILLDSLAGYLMVISLISGFPLVEKFIKTSGIPTSGTARGASLPFIKLVVRCFKPVECLFLYLVSYPIAAAYRSSSGSMSGCLSLVVVLIGLLVTIEATVTKEYIADEVVELASKTDTDDSLRLSKELFLNNLSLSSPRHKREVSEMTGDISVPDQDVSTPTLSNMKKSKKSKDIGEVPPRRRLMVGSYDDLDPIFKNVDEDDVPSIANWDPAVTRTAFDSDTLKKRIAHRFDQPLIEGDLIDSSLEPHYSNLIDSANAPIFGVDSEGRVNVWNKCAMRIVGYNPDEVMGKNLVKEFITQDYQASVEMVIDRALRGDETANYEFPLMTKEGARIEILLNATARRNPSGEIIGVVGIGQDITGRIAQEREYTRLIDTANAPIFGVDTMGRVNIWNQCAIQLVGYSTEEVMGKNLVQEFITDDFKTAVQAVLDMALHGEETANFEFPLMTKAGVRLDVLLNATTRRDEQGKVIGVVGIGQDITGRIAQEREYTRLIDTANAPIFGVDTLGRVNVWNQCAMRLVGYTNEEVMGHSLVQEFITDDFKTAVQAVLDGALQGAETENFEFPLITKNGVRIEVLLNATTRRDGQGNIIGVVGIGQDITARLAQEREYSKLIDSANAPIFGVDTFGRVNVWNQCAMQLVGYSTEEVMGKNLVKEFITDDFKTAVQAVLDMALHGEETANFEFPLMTKAGVRLDVLLNATTRRDEQGKVIGVVGIGQDITGRIAQEREYTRLIDTANAPIFGVDTLGRVNVWNQCAMRLVGYTNEEVMGHSLVQEFITDDFKTAVQAVLDGALQGAETENFEFPLITKNGVRIEVLLNATTRRDGQGNIIGVVGIGQDITARLAQEREYSKLIDSANAPIFGVDTFGRVNVWNQCAMQLVGYSTEEVMGKNLVKEFITDDFKTAVQAVLDMALHGEETANFEFPLMTKAGVRLDVLLNATTRRDEQGKVIGVVGIGQDITGRIAQEREYTRLIDTANAPIFGVDTLGRVNVWNQCAMRLVGYTNEEVMGHSLVQEFITDDFKTAVQAVLDGALQGAETENFEFPLITKNGVRIEVLLNATTRRDGQGNIIGVVGIGQDITARLAQEREYSKLIDSANAPIFGVDTFGRVNVWNQCAMQLVGYSTEEVMGKNLVKEFITDDFKTAVQAVLDMALHGEETANFEFPLMTKAGVRLDVLLNATTRRDEQGKVIGVVGIGQDITGRIAQEREYTRLIDTANAPIFGVDTLGRVNVWNQCAMRLVGYTNEEVMGHSLVQEFITDDFKTAVQAVLDGALQGAETENFEFPLITKNGVRIEVLLNATTRRDGQGNIIGVVGIGQDITARLAQEREYSKLIDSANAPIFGVDTFGRVNVWNQCAMQLVGYSTEEVMGKNLVKEFITDDFKTAVQAVLDMALHGEETANFEFPLMTKAGVRLDVLLNATTRRDEQGKVIGVVGIGQDITGRIAQEREYTRLIDTANAPIFGVDTLGRVNVWNQCAMRLVGYTNEEVMGHSLVQEFITDDFKTAVQAVLDGALQGAETENFEFPLITKNGVRIEVLLNATTRRDGQGNIIGVVGIGQDITARLAQEREYSKLIDSANAPIFGVDTFGRVNVWNQCAMQLVGYSTEEVMGKNLVKEFITDDFKTAVQAVLDMALHGEETANFEFPLMTKAGVRLDVLLNATTRRDEQGKVIGVVGIGQDITGRIAQEREYTRLIDTANAPIFGVDTLGRVNVWNQCAMRLVGYTNEEVMGHSLVQEFITDDFKTAVQAVLDGALQGAETENFEFPLITKNGVRIEVLLNATTRRDGQGNIIGVVGIGQDITARLAQEREYSKLIDSANAPIFGVDTFGRVNVWNQCAMQLVGYSTEEVMGKNLVKEFITDDFKTAVQAVLDMALHGEETANFEFPLMTKAGVRLDVLLNATTRRDEQGKVIGVVGIGQDITGRIAQEREYTRLIDTANAPIFGVDTLGRVNVWNQCAMRLVGYTNEEVMGHSLVQEFITDDFKTAVQAVLDGALQGAETENFEFPLITKNGVRIEVLLNATTRRDGQGNIIGVVGIGQDITARLAQEREYSKLIDSANAPIFGVDTFGRVNVWNQCSSKLVGYSTAEVMGHSLVKEFITKDYQASVQAVLDKALDGIETANFEFPLITKAGARIEVLLNATTRRNEHGMVIGVVGIGQDITARLAQEREYSKLIDNANAPIFGVDTQGRVNVWNKCARKIVGYTLDEVMGKNLVQEFITKEYRAAVKTVLKLALQGEETANFEFPLITKHGVRIEVLLNATTRRDEQGNIIGVVGIGQDITGRIAQEREYSKLIDSANAPIFGVDTLGRVNVWNQCANKLVGYNTDEVMGYSLVQKFITEDYQASVQAVLDKALDGIETANFEFPLITKAGARIEVLLNATTRRNEHGKVIGVVGIGQDITARLAQEREYSKLIDNANAPIFGVDTQGRVNVWNKCARKLVGYSLDEVMGKNLVQEFITNEYKAAVSTVLKLALQGEETANFEFPLITKHGVRIEVLLNATTRRDEQGNIIGVVGIGQDITGRIAQEREYSKLIDSANAPIFGVDTLGRVNVWNQCANKLVGYNTDEVMGHSLVEEFITEDYQASVQAVLDKALDGIETANFEFPLITKAGARIEVLLNATTRRNEHGKVIGVVGIGQDITARLAQEREYSKLIDNANAPIFGVDTQGRVNVWNQCAMKLVGYSLDEVMGKNLVQEFITNEYKAAVKTVLDEAMTGNETANFEFPLITKHGIRIEVLLNATTRRDEQGNIIGVVGIGQDITGRIAQEREYSKLIDTANAPIFGVDTMGSVNVWNQCARKLVGYNTDEVMGKNLVEEFITEDYQVSVQAVLDRALHGEETANFEFPLITKAGARIEILLNATTRRDEHGNIIGVVGIGQDITFRIAQEREYSKLIDHANAPIFGVDTQGMVNVWNQCAMRLVGYSSEEVMGHRLVEEFITKDYQASVQTVLDKALDGIETANFEFPLMTKAGVRLEVLLNATTRRDEQGNIIGVVGIGQDITGRITQEREYSKLIDSANAPIFGVDTEGKVTIWNQCAVKSVGYSSEEVMGQRLVQQFITPEHRARVQSVIDQALAGEETANFEFPLITKAGARIEVLLNATTRRDEQGSIIGVVGIGQDITGRLAQEREYTRLIDTANAPIFGVDTQGRVNVWNQCAVRLSGYPAEEVMGHSLVKEFIRMEHQEKVQAVFDQALHGEETANFDFPLMTKGRNRLEVLLNATTRRDEQGNIIGVVGIGQDITERIAQEREFSKLIDSANAPIFGVDKDGKVNVWNQCASTLTGFSTADVFGRSLVEDFVSAEYRESVSDILKNALMGIETANFEFPLLTSGDHVVEVLLNATTRRDAQDNVIGVVGIGQDITDARAKRDAEMKQRAAEAATAAQATISAHVYHEIRNVVGSVLALADRAMEAVDLALIEDETEFGLKELPTRVQELTDHQRLVCQHAVDTLNDMLDVAKMENGTYTPKHEVIDLGDLCRKAAALQSPRMRVTVNLELNVPSPDTLFVISDSVLLLQYLSNLLSNAAKFTACGGVILVCQVREAGPNWLEVTLGVSDSGPGIPRDSQRHVLRAFTTGDALPQEDRIGGTKSTGIGLRLADLIAHTIAEPSLKPHQDGSVVTVPESGTLSENSLNLFGPGNTSTGLRIESPLSPEHEHYVPNGGPGTFIYFQNAIQRAPQDAIARHRANPTGEPSPEIDFGAYTYELRFKGTMKVLAIDDQRTMRQMVAMIYQKIALEYPGVTIDCYTALSGEQALRMCKKHRFHIVTMDQQMSSEYCRSLMDEINTSERPSEEIPEFVRFGPDKIMNAKNRQAYFKQDKWVQDIQPGDGTLLGHEAILKIRQQIQDENLPPVLIFNLTGNLLEADRLMFLEVGSSGMLPKPTKLEDFLNLMKKNMGLYINQGLFQLSENRNTVVMDAGTEDELQIGTRYLRKEYNEETGTGERQKLAGPWAGGATQRSAVGSIEFSGNSAGGGAASA